MSAPKFIYLQWAGKEFESSWCTDPVGEDDIPDIKYVRADEHERDQRVIQAAEKMRYDFSEQNRAEYDKAKR